MTIDQSRTAFGRIALYFLFIGSGFSALTYEVVWFQWLRLVIGSSQISLAILLSSFLGGMSIGSALFHRVWKVSVSPIRVYVLLEIGIAAMALAIPVALPAITEMYISVADVGTQSVLIRSVICSIVLILPTMMMGATLPAISRWTTVTSRGVSTLAILYGANVAGAVFGVLLAGFFLLPKFDVYVANRVGVFVNCAVAILGLLIARSQPFYGQLPLEQSQSTASVSVVPIYLAIGLSGFTALGAQMIWTRQLATLIGATTYAFSAILSVFLTGMCLGSIAAARVVAAGWSATRVFGWCQLLLGPAIAIASVGVIGHGSIPTEPVMPDTGQTVWIRQLLSILPATILWGASFPLAIAAASHKASDAGVVVGRIYGVNTIGAVVATLAVTLWLVPVEGSQFTQRLLIALAAASFVLVWSCTSHEIKAKLGPARGTLLSYLKRRPVWAVVVAALSVLLVPPVQSGLISYGRETYRWGGDHEYLHVAEGRSASVAVSRHTTSGDLRFHISGKVVASTTAEDMHLQRLLGHLPALVHPEPRSVLVVGLGAGVTAGAFVRHESVERIVIVELEPEVARAAGEFFALQNHDVLADPRTEVIFDDARHYLSVTDETFDIVTADPIHPWVRGAATLYTREFFELCRDRLNTNGLITQWVPLYESSEPAIRSEIGTFLSVFSNGSIWNSQPDARGYDLILLGGSESVQVSAMKIDQRLAASPALQESLLGAGIDSAVSLLTRYAGDAQSISSWLEGYQPNLDRNLRLEYLAGAALNERREQAVFAGIVKDAKYPESLFVASKADEDVVRTNLATLSVRANGDFAGPNQ